MRPAALAIYDQHGDIMADIIRTARILELFPLDLVAETVTKMELTGRYHRPGGKTAIITPEVVALHRQAVDAARAYVAATRALAAHATALNPPDAR